MSPNDLTYRVALSFSPSSADTRILLIGTFLVWGSNLKELFSITLVLGTLAACQPQEPSLDILGPLPELGHGQMEGYLHWEPPFNSAAFVPPPPSEGPARQPADDAASEALRSLEGSVR